MTNQYLTFAYFTVDVRPVPHGRGNVACSSRPGAAGERYLAGEMSYPLFLMHGPVLIGLQFALNAAGVRPTFVANLRDGLLAAAFAAAMSPR